MNSNRILTRKTFGLDHRVWRVMIVLFVLATGLYSYKLIDKPKCTQVDFKIKTIDNDSVYFNKFNAIYIESQSKKSREITRMLRNRARGALRSRTS